jgi:hypothetical protein
MNAAAQNQDGGAHQIKVTDSGYIFTYGPYYGKVNLGNYSFGDTTSNETHGFFLAKMDPNGQVLWALNLDSAELNCFGYCPQKFWMSTDRTGSNIWFTAGGRFNFLGQSYQGTFLFKVNSAGNLLWQQSLQTDGSSIYALELDASDNVYLATNFAAQMKIGALTLAGLGDAYSTGIAKISPVGTVQWMKRVDVLTLDAWQYNHQTHFLTVDSSGDSYVGGMACRQRNLVAVTVNTGWYPWVTKLDAQGNTLFKNRYDVHWYSSGGGTHAILSAATMSKHHALFLGGYIRDTVFVTSSLPAIAAPNHPHSYIARTSTSTGYASWYRDNQYVGTGGFDRVLSVAADSFDNVFVAGDGVNAMTLAGQSISGSGRSYWAKLDANGNYLCHQVESGIIEQSTVSKGYYYHSSRSPKVVFDERHAGDTIRIKKWNAATCALVSSIDIPEKWYLRIPIAVPGIASTTDKTAELLFPNPVENGWMLIANGVALEQLKLQIFNAMGQRVRFGLSGRMVDLASQPAGVYFYLLDDGKLRRSGRFVIR